MCNNLHTNSQPIPDKGIGWKLFRKDGGQLCSGTYITTPDGWVNWWKRFKGDGFCFLLEEAEALRLQKAWNFDIDPYMECYVKKIQYRRGLGMHLQNNLTDYSTNFRIALCKSFKVIT